MIQEFLHGKRGSASCFLRLDAGGAAEGEGLFFSLPSIGCIYSLPNSERIVDRPTQHGFLAGSMRRGLAKRLPIFLHAQPPPCGLHSI